MLRRVQLACVLAGLLAACGGSRERGPAWPAPSPSETDGGESLAPRQAGAVAAIEKAEDARPAAPAAARAVEAAAEAPRAAAPAASAEAAESTPAQEPDLLMTEELIIEIED
jgi:hypothetical protein